MEHYKRHAIVWKILLPIAKLVARIVYNYRAEPAEVEGPYLFLCNHVSDWDPILVGCSFKKQMYFVTSEHLLRAGFFGKLINWLQEPIARQKGGSAADTVMQSLRRLKKGYNVAIFPEGNRCWDGVTASYPAATGKMARTAAAAGASLVTYRLEGGYFANPRWAGAHTRRGKLRGHVVNVYSPAQLKAMTPAQINDAISADIHEDAYERQRKEQIPFRGRNLAEHMETLFFLCPRCGRVHTLHSKKDMVRCSACDFSVRYLPTGFLEGNAPWDNIKDWNVWQKGEIIRLCDEAGEEPIFTDGDMSCWDVEAAVGLSLVGKGDMRLYKDRLELPGVMLPLPEIRGISLRGPQDIYFGTAEHSYLIRSEDPRCTVRYLTAIAHLNGDVEYGV